MLSDVYKATKESAETRLLGDLESAASSILQNRQSLTERSHHSAEYEGAFQQGKAEQTARLGQRIGQLFAAPGIAGNSQRMGAAIDLATKSDMEVDEIISLIEGLPIEDPLPPVNEVSYERLPLAGLAMPSVRPHISSGSDDWDHFRDDQRDSPGI